MRILICLFFSFACTLNTLALAEDWKQLRLQSQRLRYDEPVYALFKLQKAWDILARQSPRFATEILRKDLYLTYCELNPSCGERIANQSDEKITELMKDRINIEEWSTWKIRRKLNALLLFAPDSALDRRAYCLNSILASEDAAKRDPRKRKELDANNARMTAEFRARKLLMPVVISEKNEKYSELLALSKPLEVGKLKAVNFDLNPFLPKDFQKIKFPR